MLTNRTMVSLALVLGAIAGTPTSLMADPPDISEAEMEAYLAQYREEMGRLQEREQLRQKQTEARLRRERSHRERQAAIYELLRRAEPAEAGLELDASLDFSRPISLGMLQDKADAGAQAPAKYPRDYTPPHMSGPVAGHPNLAEAATNPTAPLIQFQLQNNFVASSNGADGIANTFTIQPVVPWKMGKQQWISRLTLPLVTTADLSPPSSLDSTTGLGDTVLINFALFPIKDKTWGGNWGVGPAFTFPTATEDLTGEGKWQAGVGLVYINTSTPKFQWGVIAYQQWSFAGQSDRKGVSKLFLQPVITLHFEDGWYIGSPDTLWSIDWNDNARWSIALGIKLGNVTKLGKMPVNVFIEPYYTVGNPGTGSPLWGIKLNLTLLFPE